MMQKDKAIEVYNLSKTFGTFKAVDRITFNVEKGMIYGFLGPNGSGKSTTIRMLCGIMVPTSGEGRVAGFDIKTEGEKIKAHIGYMSQRFSLYEDLTVAENIAFFSGIYNVARAKLEERKRWVIEMAGLQEYVNVRTSALSSGWKQRLALGCAIIHEPPLLFLDEPTAGVDPISRRRFWNLIYDLSSKGVTVFVTTHYMDEAEYFDRMSFIYQGHLIADGTPDELKDNLKRETSKEVTLEDVFISLTKGSERL